LKVKIFYYLSWFVFLEKRAYNFYVRFSFFSFPPILSKTVKELIGKVKQDIH